jgi:type IV pilus assembly protein PilM
VKNAADAVKLLKSRNLLTLMQDNVEMPQFDSSWTKGEVAAASEYVRAVNVTKIIESDVELEARRSIRDSFHFLTSSIARMLDYYKSNHKEITFDRVYLCGAGVLIQGIDDFFFSEIGIPHTKIDKLNMVSSKKFAQDFRYNPSEFITCIGAAINPIDFILPELVEKKQKRNNIISSVVIASVCLIGSAGIITMAYNNYHETMNRLKEIKTEYAALPQLSGVHDEYGQAVLKLDDLLKLEEMTESNNDMIKEVIQELENKLPTGTIIHSMQFNESDVIMSVTVNNDSTGPNALIAKLLIQLKTIEYFQKVDVSDIVASQENEVSKVSFTITCTYFDDNEPTE